MINKWFRYYRAHFVATLRLSIPVMVGQLGMVLMGVTDTLMIGRVGEVYLSASSLANGVFFVLTIFGMGITYAISPLVSEANGAHEPEKAGNFLKQGIWVTLGVGLLISLICWLSADWLGNPVFNQPKAEIPIARSFLRILSFSVVPMLIFLGFKAFADGMSITRPAMVITLIGLVTNALLNLILIYGWFGLPAMKLDGSGIATTISRVLMMLMMFGYVWFHKRFQKNQLHSGWLPIRKDMVWKVLYIGVPSGLQYFFEIGAFMGGMFMIGWLGTTPRAAHQEVMTLASVTYMVITGLAAGGSIRVADFMGRKQYKDLKMAGLSALFLTIIFMALTALAFLLGRDIIPPLFVREQVVIDIAARLMVIAAVFQIFDGVQSVGIANLRGVQDVWIPTLIAFVSYWLVALPIGYFLGFSLGWGVYGVWYGFVAGLFLASVLLTRRFLKLSNRWILKATSTRLHFSQQPQPDINR